MSTYYSLVCDECKEATDLVSRTTGCSFMSGAIDYIPEFINNHLGCDGSLRVVSEYQPEWDEYKHLPEDSNG